MEKWKQVEELSQLVEKEIEVLRIFNATSSFSLTDLGIQRHYQKKTRYNDVSSRNNFLKIKDRAYVINLDECKSIRTNWIAL